MTKSQKTSLERGVDCIRDYAKTLPTKPGVYRMLGADNAVLYIGKARQLARRVLSYTQPQRLPTRLRRMVAATIAMEFIVCRSEVEALLLEATLIKQLQPKFNVLLKDDKSYPYIFIGADHDFPLMVRHRGARVDAGEYYGPFASSQSVYATLNALQKAFMLRNCSDEVFKNRTRPCLQYHIKRCTAPCVGRVTQADYAAQLQQAKEFLGGNSQLVQSDLAALMQQASDGQDYERAAMLRDRIRALTALQSQHSVSLTDLRDADVVGVVMDGGQVCVQVFFYRGGSHYGNRAFFPSASDDEDIGALLASFLIQFYDTKPVPRAVLLSHVPDDLDLLVAAFSERMGHKIDMLVPQRGPRRDVMQHVVQNATEALQRHRAEKASQQKMLQAVADLFGLSSPPQRIEVYDNSHIQGQFAVGAMIVAGPTGFIKNAYRKFTIKNTEDMRDDYAMMREVFTRRFTRALKESENNEQDETSWPDLVLIDGGAGQLSAVQGVMQELGLAHIPLVAIAKGADRNAGREKFFMEGRTMFQLPERDATLFYLQKLRDEAHRFVIGAHRKKREKNISATALDELPGIGARRKKALLLHFGSAKAVQRASVQDLAAVDGISPALAQTLYGFFNPSD